MALVNIDDPGDAPVTIADWYKVNAVLQTIGNGMGGGSRVVGSVFPRGAVVFFAGAWYIADADTAISGTASKYVKITNTAGVLSLSFVADITGVTWNKQYQGYYDALGNMYLFDEIIAYGDGVIDTLYTVVNTRVSQEFSKIISNISTNYKRLLRPTGKTILTVGSGTYTVPAGVYNIEVFLQGPGQTGFTGGVGGIYGRGGASGATLHKVIDVTPGQTIAWLVSASTTTFGSDALSSGGGHNGQQWANGQAYPGFGGGDGGGNNTRSPIAGSGGGGMGSYTVGDGQSGATGRIEIW